MRWGEESQAEQNHSVVFAAARKVERGVHRGCWLFSQNIHFQQWSMFIHLSITLSERPTNIGSVQFHVNARCLDKILWPDKTFLSFLDQSLL